MKTVFSNSREIPHLWAHQTQSEARAGNVSFRDSRFFSYSTVIAQLIKVSKGETVAVFDSCGYSVSTRKHQGFALGAVDHLRRFYVLRGRMGNSDLTPTKSDLADKLAEIWQTVKDCETGKGSHKARFERIQGIPARVEQVREFSKVFKLGALSLHNDVKRAMKPETVAEYQARADAAEAKRNTPAAIAKREKARAYRAEKKAKEWAEAQERARLAREERERQNVIALAEWKEGKRACCPSGVGMFLRLDEDDGRPTVETSQGARVPLSAALKLFRVCQKVRARAIAYTPLAGGFKVGHYELTAISKKGNARVGCHLLPFAEMERLFLTLSPSQIHEANTPSDLSLS